MASIRNESKQPLALYVVHHADSGFPVVKVRTVATLILQPGERCGMAEFRAYLETSGCAFRAALVSKNGAVVLTDPRHFADLTEDEKYDRFGEGYTDRQDGEPFDPAQSTEWKHGWRTADDEAPEGM